MQLKSIQQKIVLLAGLCLLATSATLVVFGIFSTRETQKYVSENVGSLLHKNAEGNLEAIAKTQAAVIQSALQDNLDTARTMATVFEVLQKHNSEYPLGDGQKGQIREVFNDLLRGVLENNPGYLGAYSAWEPNALDGRDADFSGVRESGQDDSGRFTPYWNRDANGKIAVQVLVDYESQDKYDNGIRKGGWYLTPRETGKENVLDPFPYIVQGKKEWLTTISVPVKENGKFLGVAGTDLRLDFLQDLAKEVDANLYSGQGDVVIVSYEGLIVASSEHGDHIGSSISKTFPNSWNEILGKVQQGESLVDSDSSGRMRALAPIKLGRTGKPWSIVIRVDPKVTLAAAESLEAALKERSSESSFLQMGVGLGVTLAAIILLWFFAATLAKPLRRAAGFAQHVAQGDFSQALEVDQKDEIGVLAGALKTMVANLQKMIAEAEEKSQEAAKEAEIARNATEEAERMRQEAAQAQRQGKLDAARRLETVVASVLTSSNTLSSQIKQAREGAERQSHHTGETASSMEEMNATVLEVARHASDASERSETAKQRAQEGAKVVHKVVEAINTVHQQTEHLKTNMNELGDQAQGIGQIIDVISDIADQTNLLALNAAIEAARAGEAGRGFAVVADEVRKLAEKTMAATTEVGNAIQSIQSGASTSIAGMERAVKAVDEANSLAEKSGTVLMEIVEIVESSADQVRSIATASEEQSAASDEITRAIGEINQISVQTSENMGESSDAVADMAGQIKSLQQLVRDLKEG